MAVPRVWPYILSGALAAFLCGGTAYADYFSPWVAATCNPGSGMAAVRFGYADARDVPLFMAANPSIDHGVTAMPASNASQREAACSLPSGRQVKVRLGTGYSDQGDQYSIWIDKIRVIHGVIDTSPVFGTGKIEIPFAVLVYPQGFRACYFRLPSEGLYDVTTAGATSPPPSIHCDTALSPIQGPRDLVEYPLSRTIKPKAGSIIVSGADTQLCRRMVMRYSAEDAGADDAIDDTRLGSVLSLYQFDIIGRLPKSGDPVAYVAVTTVDLFGTGHPVPVYGFSSGGTFPEEFLVVPPRSVSRQDVIAMAKGVSFDDIEARARQRGWRVFSGARTSSNPMLGLAVRLIRTKHQAYLLWYPRVSNHLAVLVKPLPSGRIAPLCSFKRVAPHF